MREAPAPPPQTGEPFLFLDRIEVNDLVFDFVDGKSEGDPLHVELERVGITNDPAGTATTEVEAMLNDLPVRFKATNTRFERLIDGAPLEAQLEGSIRSMQVRAQGHIDDLTTLAGATVEASVSGPDVALVTGYFDLPSLGDGEYRVDATLLPTEEGSEMTFDADLVDLQVDADGFIDSLLDPKELRLEWIVSAVDLQAAGALLGVDDLPHGNFEASGEMLYDGDLIFRGLKGRLDDHVARVEGMVRPDADLVQTELRFSASGPDLSIYAPVAGVGLPASAFSLEGGLSRIGDRVSIDDIHGRVGEIDLNIEGTVDETFSLDGADLEVRIAGPDLNVMEPLAGIALPDGSFEVEGDVRAEGDTLTLSGMSGRAGENRFEVDGALRFTEGLVGTQAELRVWGPDPRWISPWTGLDELVPKEFDLQGSVLFEEGGRRISGVKGRYGDASFLLDGFIGLPPAFAATDLQIELQGEELAWFADALELYDGAPRKPFDVDGRLLKRPTGLGLQPLHAEIGATSFTATGLLESIPEWGGAELELEIRTEDLSELEEWEGVPELPPLSAELRGGLSIDPGTFTLREVEGVVEGQRVRVDGKLVAAEGLVGSDLTLEVSGPEMEDVARIVRDFADVELPGLLLGEYSLDARVAIDETGYDLERVEIRVQRSQARLSGRLGNFPELHDSSLTVEISGEEASFISRLTDEPFPARPFSLSGRFERQQLGVEIHDLEAAIGDYRMTLDGTLGEPPELVGTNLSLWAGSPGPELLVEWFDLPVAPGPVEIEAHFDGDPGSFAMDRFSAKAGGNDLRGTITVDLRGERPDVRGELFSDRIDLSRLAGGVDESGLASEEVVAAEEKRQKKKKEERKKRQEEQGRLIPDTPLDFPLLEKFDLRISWEAELVRGLHAEFHDTRLELELEAGRIEIGPLTAAGRGGTMEATLVAEPLEEGYHFRASGRGAALFLSVFPYRGDPSELPPLDIELDVDASGATMRDVAASASGRLVMSQASGKVDRSVVMRISDGALSAINPLSGRDNVTDLDCSVFAAFATDGLVKLDPLALRTDTMVVVGSGTIDLDTERLGLTWAAKPRKGVGISASALTNSYIKLGGTLSNPRVEISPLKATGTTGAAIMTGGLSLLGKAVYDRATSGREVCDRARKRVAKLDAKKNP